jgi:hypothetical protein
VVDGARAKLVAGTGRKTELRTVTGRAWWSTVGRFWGRWREGGRIWGEARETEMIKLGVLNWFW